MEPIDIQAPHWDGWYDKICQLKETGETIENGIPTQTLVPATGVPSAIACNVQPSGGRQVQLGPTRFELSSHLVYLRGHFPQINSSMTALVEGRPEEILLVENDGADCCTVLVTRSQ